MSQEFLFALWAGGGNVGPQLAVARRLRERGHQVRVLAPGALQQRIEAAGLTFEPYVALPEHDESEPATSLIRDFEARTPVGALRAARDRLIIGTAAAAARDVAGVLARRSIDVVVPDYLLVGALFAAEQAGVPAVPLIHHFSFLPTPGVPPFGTGWQPATGARGRLRDAVGRLAFERLMARPLLAGLSPLRAQLGLEQVDAAFDVYLRCERVLVLASEALEFPGQRPANVVYVGAQLDPPTTTAGFDWSPSAGSPAVLVGLSTTFQGQDDLLRRAVEAIGRLPVTGVAGTGPVDLTTVADNVSLHPFVPHRTVLPHVAAVVTHAGHGTVSAALAHGVPVVCLPLGRDQPDVAARVVRAGAGLRLSPRSSTARIASAISTVLQDPSYGAAARRIQTAMAAEERSDRAVSELEAVAAGSAAAIQTEPGVRPASSSAPG